MFQRSSQTIFALIFFMATHSASALTLGPASINYGYLEIEATEGLDDAIQVSRAATNGGFEIGRVLYFQGGVEELSATNFTARRSKMTLGARGGFALLWDGHVRAGLARSSIRASDRDPEFGLLAAAGTRIFASEVVELFGEVRYEGDFDRPWGAEVGVYTYVLKNTGIGIKAGWQNDEPFAGLSARFYY